MLKMKFSLLVGELLLKDIRNPSLKLALLNGIHVLNRFLHIRISVFYVVRPPFLLATLLLCKFFYLFSCDNGSSCSEIEFEDAYYANNSIVMYQRGLKYIITKIRSIHLSGMGK